MTAADDVRLRSIEVTFVGVTKACAASPCRVSFFAPQAAAPTSHAITAVARDASGRSASAYGLGHRDAAGRSPSGRGGSARRRAEAARRLRDAGPLAGRGASALHVRAVGRRLGRGRDRDDRALPRRREPRSRASSSGCRKTPGPRGRAARSRISPKEHELALVARATDGVGESAEARSVLVVREGLRIRGPALLAERGDELADATLYVEGEVAVEGELLVGELHLRAGAALRPSASAVPRPHAIRIRASGDLVLDAGSRVDVSATGTWRASELDPGAAPDREGDGAPHGGDAGTEGALRAAYGSASEPVLPGARGGIAGTFGGGVVSLFARRIVLAGVVEANGEDGNADRPAWRGLGAGGSIFLVAEEMVTGPVDADVRDVEDRRWGFLSARGGAPSPFEAVPFAGAFAAGGRLVALGAASRTSASRRVGNAGAERSPLGKAGNDLRPGFAEAGRRAARPAGHGRRSFALGGGTVTAAPARLVLGRGACSSRGRSVSSSRRRWRRTTRSSSPRRRAGRPSSLRATWR